MKSVALIAAHGIDIGHGHTMRMNALRDLICSKCHVDIINRRPDEPLSTELLQSTYATVVFDDYSVAKTDIQFLTASGVRTVVVDDFSSSDYGANTIVHHIPGSDSRTIDDSGVEHVSGTTALLLRQEFCETRWTGLGKYVLVSFGMSEQGIAISRRFAQLLRKKLGKENVVEISELVPPTLNASALAAHIANARLVVCSASTFALESLVVGAPMCCGTIADNQEQNYASLLKCENVSGIGEVTLEAIRRYVDMIVAVYETGVSEEHSATTLTAYTKKMELWQQIVGIA